MEAVLATEEDLGRDPEEMPRNNPGFDIRSRTPDGHLLFVEVKGRIEGSDDVTVTNNEILFGLGAGDQHVLALVEVGKDGGEKVRYLRHAFDEMVGGTHSAMKAGQFFWQRLWDQASEPS